MKKREKAPAKTYLSRYPSQSFSFVPDNDIHSDTILFVGGEFTTDILDEQEHIESRDQFKHGLITIKPSPRSALEAAATSLRASAVKANAAAKDAEDALAAFDESLVAK